MSEGPAKKDLAPLTPPAPAPNLLSRRAFIGTALGVAAGCALIGFGASQIIPSFPPAGLGGGGEGPIIFRDKKNPLNKVPVTVRDLPSPANWPNEPYRIAEWAFLPAMIFVVPVAVLRASSRIRGWNTAQHAVPHPDNPDFAIMAFEAKCKHLGCTVGWNGGLGGSTDHEDYDGDGNNDGRILCPCHQGQYDIYTLAANVPGTPPPEPLNVIQIVIGDAKDSSGATVRNSIIGFNKIVQGKTGEGNVVGDGSPFELGAAVPVERRNWNA